MFLGEDEGPEFINGGIIVSTDGKIQKILRSGGEVNSYVYTHESEAVRDFLQRDCIISSLKLQIVNRCLISKIKC